VLYDNKGFYCGSICTHEWLTEPLLLVACPPEPITLVAYVELISVQALMLRRIDHETLMLIASTPPDNKSR
jgi:hypothetical protein